MARDTTQQLGWAWEAAAETDPINAVDALYWKFGVLTTDNKGYLHPIKTQQWEPVYKVGSRVPSDMDLVANTVSGNYGFYSVNGIPLYMVLGESATVGTVHTVTDVADGTSQQTFTVRSESTAPGGTGDKFFSAVGCKADSISGYMNLLSGFKYLSEILHFNGISAAPSTSLNAIHTTGTKHPTDDYTMTGAELTARYKYDSNMFFKWNSNDIIADLCMLKYDIILEHNVVHVDNQADTEYIDEGNFSLRFDFQLWRGDPNTDAVYDDYLSGDQRTLNFKIYNGASHYRDYTYTNATILEMTGPYAVMNEKKLWVAHGMAEDISIAVDDGCADDYYKD